MQIKTKDVLINLLGYAIGYRELCENNLKSLEVKDWNALYRLSCQQGVAAIVLNAMVRSGYDRTMIPSSLKYQWISKTLNTEKYINKLTITSKQVASILREHDLFLLALKGISYATYYENPLHREYGDLDCYVGSMENGRFVWGTRCTDVNRIMEHNGATVYDKDYKHFHIHFNDIDIENHIYCVPVLNDSRLFDLEVFLNFLLQEGTANEIQDTGLFKPPATFSALYMISHAFSHFLIEGIKLKHIADWILFLKADQNSVDWELVYNWYDKLGYTKFVNSLNYIAKKYFRIPLESPLLTIDNRFSQMIIDDCFRDSSVYNRRYSLFESRIAKLRNIYQGRWKFKKIYDRNPIIYVARLGLNYMKYGILRR